MQYVIWLAALAVLALSHLSQKRQPMMLFAYVVWQASELAFQYSFFQQILTNTYANTETPASPEITTYMYGMVGLVRYSLAIIFTFLLAIFLFQGKKYELTVKLRS